MKKRMISFVLCVIMVLAIAPTVALADYDENQTSSFPEYVFENEPFTDTPVSAWYYKYVAYTYINGLFSGTTDTTFSPDLAMSRAMLVTVLWRMEGGSDIVHTLDLSKAVAFSDVEKEKYYADAVAWAAVNEIVTGYGNGNFGPDDNITREQMAAILHRYAKYKDYDVSVGEDTNILSYYDAFDISEYAISSMQWACGAGLIQGNQGKLMPRGVATRAQVATILSLFIESRIK